MFSAARLMGIILMLSLIGPIRFVNTSAHAANAWEVYKQDDDPKIGYVLYKRKVSGSDFPEYKLIGMIFAPPEKAQEAARISAIDPQYTPPNQKRTILHNTGQDIRAYHYISLPLVSDRDLVTHTQLGSGPTPGWFYMRWEQSDEGPKKKEGVVRMPMSRGKWEFAPGDPGTTVATLIIHTDLGGSVPAWLTNSRNAEFVISSLTSIRKIAATLK